MRQQTSTGPLWPGWLMLAASAVLACSPATGLANDKAKAKLVAPRSGEEVATFAGGCFWCMEPPFEGRKGVRSVQSGYTGGKERQPHYHDVSAGRTGHTEAVQVVYDPRVISYRALVDIFFKSMDPTDADGQFGDRGKQYRPGIFVHSKAQRRDAEAAKAALVASKRFDKPVVVPIEPFTAFYPAEVYHQDYYRKSPTHYKRYRRGSGRSGFLERTWGEDIGAEHRKKPSAAELRKRLSQEQFRVTQQDGTEPPFKNAFWDNKKPGIYVDVVSGEALFSSSDKFASGTGWPSFTRPLVHDHVVAVTDATHGMTRTEVRSKFADSHLGHVFEDGPAPTGLRYCINSAALRFVPAAKLKAKGYGEFAYLFAKP